MHLFYIAGKVLATRLQIRLLACAGYLTYLQSRARFGCTSHFGAIFKELLGQQVAWGRWSADTHRSEAASEHGEVFVYSATQTQGH